ncbi:MAG: hypothetical protein GPJ34_06480 [Microcystis aeruginosa LL11-07]|jgi:hypothetical protein|nr:hypothetical protein [Microcystis aeruginosa LL11-07]
MKTIILSAIIALITAISVIVLFHGDFSQNTITPKANNQELSSKTQTQNYGGKYLSSAQEIGADITNHNSDGFDFELFTSNRLAPCIGSVSGRAKWIKSNVAEASIAGDPTTQESKPCNISFMFDNNKLILEESNCSGLHGVSCSFSGRLYSEQNHPCDDESIVTSYDGRNPNYHFYVVENVICSKTNADCTKDKVFQVMISQEQFIVPSLLDDKPVKQCRIKTLTGGNPIRTTIDQNDYSITNYTLPKHMLYPGKITRQINETTESIVVTTTGEGVGSYKSFNEWVAPDIWGSADARLRTRVMLILSN